MRDVPGHGEGHSGDRRRLRRRRWAGAVAAAAVPVAALLSACSVPFADSAPQYGFITITSAGETLVGGSNDVTPTLDLRLHGETAFRQQDVTAKLDARPLPISLSGGDATARTAPMPLGSSHHLSISIAGRAEGLDLDFSVIGPTQAQLAAHIDAGNQQLVVDAAFDDAPSRSAVGAALPGAAVTWIDPTHARIVWSGNPPPSIGLPAGLPTARGSHLAAPVSLALGNIQPGTIRRAVEPPPPSVSGVNLVAFVVDTTAGNSSLAEHQGTLQWVSPTGWQAQQDGSILGTPDPVAVARASAARLPVWPSLANDSTDPQATDALLHNPGAIGQLISTVVSSAVDGGYAGINLDFEGMPGSDRTAFTAFAKQLASALHAKSIPLMIDVVPHDTSGVNSFSAAYDLPALGAIADDIDLMAYDQHGDGGSPGPVAGYDWDQAVLAASLPGLNPAHTFLGIPLYARHWQNGAGGAASYGEAITAALAVPNARVDYDFGAETPFIASPDTSYLTYFDDADSLARKIMLAHQHGMAGVAAWRLGFEDPSFWSLFG
jgi:spore germination protein YaaH